MTKYGTYESRTPKHPPIALRVVPHRRKNLIVHPFGPGTYTDNTEQMKRTYSHSSELGEFPEFSFTPATTSESISAVSHNFKNVAKPQILDSAWLQLGLIVRTSEGVFTNTRETDESVLKQMLNKARKVNNIWFVSNIVAYAPYGTFQTGEQSSKDFAEGGLARALEHTEKKFAGNLRKIFDEKFYKLGVDVGGFDKVREPVSRIAGFGSYWYSRGGMLLVGGSNWLDYDGGCVFGVRD